MSYNYHKGAQNSQVKALICNLTYMQKEKVDHEVSELIKHTSLSNVGVEEFIHNNGVKQNLLKISGTLPINHKGATYNIPITFWIPYQFPDQPPMCFVTPTQNMAIKPRHKHVGSTGLIFHQYLTTWSPYRSNLIALSSNLQSVFGPDPPVFAKQQCAAARVQQPHYQGAHNSNQYSRPIGYQPQPNPAPRYGDYQPHAAGHHRQQPHGAAAYQQPAAAYHQPHVHGAASYNQPGQRRMQPGSQPSPPAYDQLKATREAKELADKKAKLTEEVKQKLRMKIMKFHKSWVDEANQLQHLQHNLSQAEKEIESERGGLTQEMAELKRLKNHLETANVSLQSWLDANCNNEPVNLLDTVEPANWGTKQLMKAAAHDCAIDDTLFSLDRALGEDVIDFKKYIKQVRKLTREQFFSRALSLKIKESQRRLSEASGGAGWQWQVDLGR